MTALPAGAAYLAYDGTELHAGTGPGRRFMIDARCLQGEPVAGAYAQVCALTDAGAALAYDQPEIQQVRRDAMAWWIGLLGDALVCLTTLALDEARYGGAITVTREPVRWGGRSLRTDLPRHRRAQRPVLPGLAAGGSRRGALRRDRLAGREVRRRALASSGETSRTRMS